MYIIPAIDIKDGACVRLVQGERDSAQKVGGDPLEVAKEFEKAGAKIVHIVDLDGALKGEPVNHEIIFEIAKKTSLMVQAGGGIRNMEVADLYINNGVGRIVMGSAARDNKEFLKEVVEKYGKKVVVSVDAKDGMVAAEGWQSISSIDCIEFAREIEKIGVKNIIFTDISKNGTMDGPNYDLLDKLNYSTNLNVIASGGVSSLKDIINLSNLNLYGAVCGKVFYSGIMDYRSAVTIANLVEETANKKKKMPVLDKYFTKSVLIPAVIQDDETGEVLMLGNMNKESLMKTIETGKTWFYSRTRQEIWNMGAEDGNYQNVVTIIADYDNDALLIKVKQIGNACINGAHSTFFRVVHENK